MEDFEKKELVEAAPVAKEEATKESKKSAAKKPAAEVVPPIPAAPVVAAPAEVAKYRVLVAQTIAWRGALTRLNKDKILSEAHWGKEGIENLKIQGVKMEPVK